MRISRKNLASVWQIFLSTFGYTQARTHKDVGGLNLSHDSVYGWQLEQVVEGGGVTHPFGSRCYSTTEMYHMLWFAVNVRQREKVAQS